MPFEVRTITPDEVVPWLQTIGTAFLEHPDAPTIARNVLDGNLWDFSRVWGAFDGDRPVGTLRTWATELTVPGGALVPGTAVVAVTVLPSHRRRGILRQMVAAEHAAARERDEQVALLHAAESPIYGRFGYGQAVTQVQWTLDASATGWVAEAPGGVAFMEPSEAAADVTRELFDRYRRSRVGEIGRRDFTFWHDLGLGESGWGNRWKGFLIVHRDAAGEIDGYARYTGEGRYEHHLSRGVVTLQDLVALNTAAYDALWRFLADLDLVSHVKLNRGQVTERLPWLLTNHRAAEVTDVSDSIWAALLDVEGALAGRRYEQPFDAVLEVIEAEPGAGRRRFRLEGGPDGASTSTSRRSPDLTLHADALGAAYLGWTPLANAALQRGLQEHRPGALARVSAAFRTVEEPRNSTFF